MKYQKNLHLPQKELEEIAKMLITEPKDADECFGEDLKISHAVVFDNGMSMSIELCGVKFEEGSDNLPWTQAVLYDVDGVELCFSEPSEEYEDEWTLEHDGDEFIVKVLPALE